MKYHILYIVQNYSTKKQPGNQRHYYHIKALLDAGFKVTLITSFANNIDRSVPDEYIEKNSVLKEEISEDFTIYRVSTTSNYKKTLFSRIINMGSYAINALNVAIKIKDVNLTIASSPYFFVGIVAYGVKLVNKVNFVFEVRDPWPDIPIALGILKNKLLISIAKYIEKLSYKKSCAVIGLSQSICDIIENNGINKEKIYLLPNAADLEIYEGNQNNNKPLSLVRDSDNEFIITYAGVLSSYTHLHNLVKAAQYLKDYKDIKIVIVGNGTDKTELEELKNEMSLDNVYFYGNIQKNNIPKILASSDVCYISLANIDFLGSLIAIKTFDYMAASRPILCAVPKGEISNIVEAADCGITVNPSENQEIADKILWMYQNKDLIEKMGRNGLEYVIKHYNRSDILKEYVNIITKLMNEYAS